MDWDEGFFGREQAYDAIVALAGVPLKRKTWIRQCSEGKGPRIYAWFGRRALYRRQDVHEWLTSRCRPGDVEAVGSANE
jgi:hypothetical protein